MSKHKAEHVETAPAPEAAASASAPVGEQELQELRAKAAKADQYYEQLLRTTADFDNFRKRAARERLDAVKFANESLLQKLVPVLDSFDAALAAATGPNVTVASLQSGIAMIHSQLKSALAEGGLEEVDAAGKAFDPAFHEAVAQEPSGEVPEGHVVRQMRKGYRLRERLLRPATVIVAQTPAEVADELGD